MKINNAHLILYSHLLTKNSDRERHARRILVAKVRTIRLPFTVLFATVRKSLTTS